jgi:hypothetical protein
MVSLTVKFTIHLLFNKFLNSPSMSSFENFNLDFSLESTHSSLEKEFLMVEEHCKMIEWKCNASKAKAMEAKAWFDKLLGNKKRAFLMESLTLAMNSNMANIEELKEARKARDSLKIAMVSFFDIQYQKVRLINFQGLASKTMGGSKLVGSLKGKVSVLFYVILSY